MLVIKSLVSSYQIDDDSSDCNPDNDYQAKVNVLENKQSS